MTERFVVAEDGRWKTVISLGGAPGSAERTQLNAATERWLTASNCWPLG